MQIEAKKSLKRQCGITLIEVLIVLLLMGLILAITIPLLTPMLLRYRVTTSAEKLAIQLRFARNACLKRKIPYRVVITEVGGGGPPSPNTYAIEYNSGGVWTRVTSMDFTLSKGVEIHEVTPDGPILFNTNGSVSNEFNIDVEIPGTLQYRVEINRFGSVSKKCTQNCG